MKLLKKLPKVKLPTGKDAEQQISPGGFNPGFGQPDQTERSDILYSCHMLSLEDHSFTERPKQQGAHEPAPYLGSSVQEHLFISVESNYAGTRKIINVDILPTKGKFTLVNQGAKIILTLLVF